MFEPINFHWFEEEPHALCVVTIVLDPGTHDKHDSGNLIKQWSSYPTATTEK